MLYNKLNTIALWLAFAYDLLEYRCMAEKFFFCYVQHGAEFENVCKIIPD